MATTLIPPGESTTPAPAPRPRPVGELRFVLVRADLLPEEIVNARHTDVIRRRVLIGLAALVAVLVAAYGFSWLQTNSARSDLSDAQRQGAALAGQQQQFAPLVKAQADTATIQTQLQRLMAGDLSWTTMLTTLRGQAPHGVTLATIGGTSTAGAAATAVPVATTGGYQALNQTGQEQVGTLTLAGSAPSKNVVAAYADRLAKVKGLTAPIVSSIATTGHTVSFAITAIITADALGGRFVSTSPATNAPAANAPAANAPAPTAASSTGGK